jgi:ABC-type lipoprotein export system ATPase subunit
VILADEPTANVDPDTREFVILYLLEQAQTEQRIVIVATHDHTLLPRFDSVVNLDKSRVS